jgi:hypothetical protein
VRRTIDARRRASVVMLLVVGLLALSTGGAAAGKPDKEPLDAPTDEYAAGEICGFPIRVEYPTNKEFIKTFYDADGEVVRQIVTGQLTVRVTNLVTMESLDANVSGPGRFIPNPDGTLTIVATGNWVLYTFATDVTGAGIWLTTGRMRLVIGLDGDVVEADLPHETTDVCALLG